VAVMIVNKDVVRIAALGDIHHGKSAVQGTLQSLFSQITDSADILVLCGDLTDYGHPDEARALAREMTSSLKIPSVAVLGNHDFESGHQVEVMEVLTGSGLILLDGDACELAGVGLAGVKGFAGGFGSGLLAPWGEPMIKAFVQESVDEALKLESALRRLKTEHRVVLLHYAPVVGTVEGEPPEIFPFLGSSRLEEPLERYPVDLVLHGHAHRGAPESTTGNGTPVYNVSQAVLRAVSPDLPPLRFFDIG
jgi:Icc-related predicted phosphoesterase